MTDAAQRLHIWFALRRLDDQDRGASLVEYALLVALIAIVCIVAVQFLGNETSSSFDDAGDSFANTN
jgi:Flp pilus assembly pilin Flp